ncbi:MAG TPA: hypothetical protein VKB87_02410 [Myxococcaceae bacterium]|nr:hypothetical protein [Myxococcaceae bacterium]
MDTALATAPAQTRQTWVPLAVSIAIPLELATVAAFSLRHDRGPVLFVAAAMDSLILCGGALWFLSRWAGGYANLGLTPRRWLRMLMLAAIPASLAGSLLGIPAVLRLRAVLLVGELAFIAAIVFAATRAARVVSQRDFWSIFRTELARHLPRAFVELAATELEILSASIRSLGRAKVDPAPGVFTTLRTSKSGFILPFIALISLVEMPALHLALRFWLHAPFLIHVSFVLLHVYGLLWLLGDRRRIFETGHRCGQDGLDIQLGQRWRCSVPYAQIERVGRQPQPVGTPDKSTRNVTPWDPPNVHLCLKAPVRLEGYFGLKRSASHLRLFVDSPDELVAAVRDRIARRQQLRS